MSGDPGTLLNGAERSSASHLLDLFERCPSEHAKTVFIREELVPWIQGKRELSLYDGFDPHQMRQLLVLTQFRNVENFWLICVLDCSDSDVTLILEFLIPKYAAFQ